MAKATLEGELACFSHFHSFALFLPEADIENCPTYTDHISAWLFATHFPHLVLKETMTIRQNIIHT
jgi:hypothetical protein